MNSEIKNERFLLSAENVSYKQFFDTMHTEFVKLVPSIKVGKFLSDVAWRFEKLRSTLTGSKPFITKETAYSANRISTFSNAKIKKAIEGYQFIPVEQSIKDTCRLFLKDQKN